MKNADPVILHLGVRRGADRSRDRRLIIVAAFKIKLVGEHRRAGGMAIDLRPVDRDGQEIVRERQDKSVFGVQGAGRVEIDHRTGTFGLLIESLKTADACHVLKFAKGNIQGAVEDLGDGGVPAGAVPQHQHLAGDGLDVGRGRRPSRAGSAGHFPHLTPGVHRTRGGDPGGGIHKDLAPIGGGVKISVGVTRVHLTARNDRRRGSRTAWFLELPIGVIDRGQSKPWRQNRYQKNRKKKIRSLQKSLCPAVSWANLSPANEKFTNPETSST